MNRFSNIIFRSVLLLVLRITQACAQTTPMIHYTTEDGLPSDNVYTVYRDSKGYLWFGTDKGIARYNGVSFVTYTTSDGLTDNEIFLMKEDQQHRLWMITYNGKLCYYKDGKFYSEKNLPFLKLPFKPAYSPNININEDGSISFLYKKMNIIADLVGAEIKYYNCDALAKKYKMDITWVKKKSASHFILYATNGKMLIDSQLRVINYDRYDNDYIFAWDNESNVWMLRDSSIYDLERRYVYPQVFGFYNNPFLQDLGYILTIRQHKDAVFFCTRNGLYLNKHTRLLQHHIVTSCTPDRVGHLWATTYKNGVYAFNNSFDSVLQYNVAEDKDMMAVRVFDGVLYYQDARNGRIYKFQDGKTENVFPHFTGNSPVNEFYVDNTYIVLQRQGIFTINSRTVRREILATLLDDGKKYTKLMPQIIRGYSGSFYANGAVYLTSRNDIATIDLDMFKKGDGRYYHNFKMPADETIMNTVLDADSMLWVSSNKHVYRYINRQMEIQPGFDKVFRRFTFLGNYLVGYNEENVLSVHTTGKAAPQMIGCYEGGNRIWSEIYKISETRAIVMTSNIYYILDVDPSRDKCTLKVLENRFVPLNARYVYTDGTYCFFLKSGRMTQIPLRELDAAVPSPSIYFTRLRKDGKGIDIDTARSFVFDKARDLNIEYDYISYGNKDLSCQYAVSKEGEDDNWNDIKGNTINLSAPGYGTYAIKLRVRDEAGSYTLPVSIAITIQRPFWLSWWFLTIAVITAGVLIFIITRSIVLVVLRRRKKMYELESKYHSAEYKTLNALMNPHFIFNSLNNIKGLMNKDDKKTANKFLNSFSNVIRQNMQNLSKETVSLNEELQLVSRYLDLERLRFGSIINYEVRIAPGVDVEEIFIPPLLIQPLAENAVKHGLLPLKSEAGMIEVHVYEQGHSLFIAVRDNGLGLNKRNYTEHEGYESLGLSNIEKRLLYLRQSGKQQIYFTLAANHKGPGVIATIEIRDVAIKE